MIRACPMGMLLVGTVGFANVTEARGMPWLTAADQNVSPGTATWMTRGLGRSVHVGPLLIGSHPARLTVSV